MIRVAREEFSATVNMAVPARGEEREGEKSGRRQGGNGALNSVEKDATPESSARCEIIFIILELTVDDRPSNLPTRQDCRSGCV